MFSTRKFNVEEECVTADNDSIDPDSDGDIVFHVQNN